LWQRRPRQAHIREPNAAHDGQLAVTAQARIGEQHHDETGNGQDDGQKARDQQRRELDEHKRREPVIHHDLDEAQRLRQPDERQQPNCDQRQRHAELADDIAVDQGRLEARRHVVSVVAIHGALGKSARRCTILTVATATKLMLYLQHQLDAG